MWVFYALMLIPLSIQHFTVGKGPVDIKKKNTRAIVFFFVLLTILIAFRHESIGNDTRNYINIFYGYSKLDWQMLGSQSMEIGFAYFNKIISLFTREPQVFLGITAVITVMMIYPTYKRLCVDSSLTIVLYVTMSTFVMAFSGIRQMLAIAIGFIAYEFTRNKKFVPFFLMVLLAMTFHISAFILLFMYPIYHARITKKWLIAVVPIIIAIFVFNERIFLTLEPLFELYIEYNPGIEYTGAHTMIILFVLFAVFAFLIPDEAKLNAETIGLRNLLLLAVALQLFAPLHTLAMRMNYYYIILIPLLIPKIIEARSNRWSQVAVVARYAMVIFFLVYFFLNAYVSEGNLHVFPYHFFWESI